MIAGSLDDQVDKYLGIFVPICFGDIFVTSAVKDQRSMKALQISLLIVLSVSKSRAFAQ